jgi:hypothetical protein
MTVGLTPDEGEGLDVSATEVAAHTTDVVIQRQRHLPDLSDGRLDHVAPAPDDELDAMLDHEHAGASNDPVIPESGDSPDTRRELREARRLRRRTLWLCAGVLALCLGLTALTVDLARSRPMPGSAAAMIRVAAPHSSPFVHRSTPGDLSPRGGTS